MTSGWNTLLCFVPFPLIVIARLLLSASKTVVVVLLQGVQAGHERHDE